MDDQFKRGYADGRRAMGATRHWKHRETIRLGLETFWVVCAWAAQQQEARIVDQGLQAVRDLVRMPECPVECSVLST